jgi:hypothetical protein
MKVLLEIELRIDGKCSERKILDNFMEWFEPAKHKISPDKYDDEYQVWIERIIMRGRYHER